MYEPQTMHRPRFSFLDNGAFVAQYLYDDDPLIGMQRAGTMGHVVHVTRRNVHDILIRPEGVYRVVSDQLGSVKLIIRTDGFVAEARSYDAWGVPRWTWGSVWSYAPFGFAGGLWDERANRVRFGARDYDPWSMRWCTKDPSRFGGGINLYVYANNDPVNYTDPGGR
jgi:RHS repeat-associated protein